MRWEEEQVLGWEGADHEFNFVRAKADACLASEWRCLVVSDPGRNVKVGVKDLGHVYIETHVSMSWDVVT